MSPQEAYNMEFKHEAFGKHSCKLTYFSRLHNINNRSLTYYYNKFNQYLSLESIIIYTKLHQGKPEVCIDLKYGKFITLEEYCEENGLDEKISLEKLKNGATLDQL